MTKANPGYEGPRAELARRIITWAGHLHRAVPRLISCDLSGITGVVPLSAVVHLASADDRAAAVAALPFDAEWTNVEGDVLDHPVWHTLRSTTSDAAPQTAALRARVWDGTVRITLLSPSTPAERAGGAS